MSASEWTSRSRRAGPQRTNAQQSKQEEPPESKDDSQGWVGVDFAQSNRGRPSRALLPLLVLALLVGLGVASLRIDLIRTRYALAAATAQEKELIAEQHALIVRKRQLVDPVGLANLARERGFRPAEASRVLLDPMPGERGTPPSRPTNAVPTRGTLPPVAAAPPDRFFDETPETPRAESP